MNSVTTGCGNCRYCINSQCIYPDKCLGISPPDMLNNKWMVPIEFHVNNAIILNESMCIYLLKPKDDTNLYSSILITENTVSRVCIAFKDKSQLTRLINSLTDLRKVLESDEGLLS